MKNRQSRRPKGKIDERKIMGWTEVGKLTAADVGECSGAIVNVLQVVVDGRPAAWIQKKKGRTQGCAISTTARLNTPTLYCAQRVVVSGSISCSKATRRWGGTHVFGEAPVGGR